MKKKIKILFAINCLNIGGAPTVVYEQIKNINKENFDPYLLTLYPSKKANFFPKLSFLNEEKIKNFNLKNRSIFDFKTVCAIYKFIKKEKFDVVYTHLFLTNLLIRSLAVIARVPVIISFEHSMYVDKKGWHIVADKMLSFFTNKIIVSTKAVLDFTSKQEGISMGKFDVISNPISLPDEKDININKLKGELNIPRNAFVILTLGRYSEEKGQIYLINAAEKLINKYNNFYFLLIGHGPLESKLRDEIGKRGLKDKCKLIVEPERAKEFLYIGDIFVLPSLREGQSIVVYEALMVGLCVVASGLESIKDIIEDGKNGLLFNPGDFEELADKIDFLFNNPESRRCMSEQARLSTRNDFLKNNIIKLEKIIYDEIAK